MFIMAEDKKGFILYADQQELFKSLPNELAGELIKHIFAYVNDENPISENPILNIAFLPIKNQFKRDLKKWEKTRQARSKAGKASAEARKKKQQELTNSTHVKFVQQNEQSSTNPTVKVNDNVKVNVNVNDNVIDDDVLKTIDINFENYLKDRKLVNAFCENQKISEISLNEKLKKFNQHLSSVGQHAKKEKDYRSHFLNWFKKQKNEKQQIVGGRQTTDTIASNLSNWGNPSDN